LISAVGCGRDLLPIDAARLLFGPMNENGLFDAVGGTATIVRPGGDHLPLVD
jgi:hypothetical protein